jgi:hypothetical protein
MKRTEYLLLILFFTSVCSSSAQKNEFRNQEDPESEYVQHWNFGLNMGMILPDKQSANFYNGSAINENSANRILDNLYFKQQIVENIGYNYKSYDLPENMAYKAAMSVGFYGRYNFSARSAFITQFNYHRLKANDIFLLNLEVPGGFSFEPTYYECAIIGQEARTNIDIGYMRSFPLQKKISIFTEIGFNLNNTVVDLNMIGINNLQYTIKYAGEHPQGPYSNNTYYDLRQGGIGYGGFITTGLSLEFNESVSLDPAISIYWSKVSLAPYDAFGPNFIFFVRFVMKNSLF